MKGILADQNVVGQVEHLVRVMKSQRWSAFWDALNLTLYYFADMQLSPEATDLDIWMCCQREELILITDNRNDDSPDSLASAIRRINSPAALPVFTISNLKRFGSSREYEERVIDSLFGYLLRIDEIRGAGRLFLP